MSSSGDEGKVAAFPHHEYDAIEKAVMESARGRWFLQEYTRRNRSADTLTLLDAIGRLQNALGAASPASSPPSAEIISLAEVIKSTRADIAATRNDMLPESGALANDPSIYAKISEHAKTTASEIMAGAQRLNALTGELRAANANDEQVSTLEQNANSFQALAWSQDVLSQRVAKAMGLLSHVDESITAMSALVRPQPVEPHQLRYFAPDEALFAPVPASRPAGEAAKTAPSPAASAEPPERKGATVVVHRVKPVVEEAKVSDESPPAQPAPEEKPQASVPVEEGKRRIVIIRRPRGEAVEIPLAGSVPDDAA